MPTDTAPLSGLALREAFSHVPQGMALVAAEIDGVRHGLVASTLTVGVSLEPPLISLAVQHSSRTWPVLDAHGHLGVTVLGNAQAPFARQLASTDRERRFDGLDTVVDPGGALTLQGAPVWMTTRVHDRMRAGDHDVILLEVLSIGSTPGSEAVVFHRSRFKELAPEDYSI